MTKCVLTGKYIAGEEVMRGRGKRGGQMEESTENSTGCKVYTQSLFLFSGFLFPEGVEECDFIFLGLWGKG